MAVRMPDALKTERDEIDENDWAVIQKVIKEMDTHLHHWYLLIDNQLLMSEQLELIKLDL